MQKTRSGLAAAAAKLQLTDTPEGESSLQSRLNEAERRAKDAEASAQDARAALTRTLLEAAQVEAVVTARVKAQSEAELSALRSQLDAVKAAAPKRPDPREDSADRKFATAETQVGASRVDAPKAAVPNPPARPAGEAAESVEESPETAPEKKADKTPGETPCQTMDGVPAALGAAVPDERLLPPEIPDAVAIDAAESRLLRLMPPARLAFLSVTAVVAVISYLVASNYLQDRARQTSVAMNAVSDIADTTADDDRLVQGAATDSNAIADAAATLDAELARLQTLSNKVAAMRAFVAERTGKSQTASRAADRKVAADRVASTASAPAAGWLLYMPVERDALVQYLAGRSWPGIQLAAQGKSAGPSKN